MHPEGVDGRQTAFGTSVVEDMGVEQHLQLGLQTLNDGSLNRVGHPGAHVAAQRTVHRGGGQALEGRTARQPEVGAPIFQRDAVVAEPGSDQRQQLAGFVFVQWRAGRVGLMDLVRRDMPVAGRDEGTGLAAVSSRQRSPGNQPGCIGQLHATGQCALMRRREVHLVALHQRGRRQRCQQGLQVRELQTVPCLGNVGRAAGIGNNDFGGACAQGLGGRQQRRGQRHGRYCRAWPPPGHGAGGFVTSRAYFSGCRPGCS